MVKLTAPLTDWQVEVLQWIADGCPEGVLEGFTYKTTAKALQTRALVTVSRKGGAWRAELTTAGRYYLDHGRYPDDVRRRSPQRLRPQSAAAKAPPAPGAHASAAPAQADVGPRFGPARPTVEQFAVSLVEQVLLAGGEIKVDTRSSRTDYDAVIAATKKAPNLPSGKKLRRDGGPYSGGTRIYLDEDFWVQVAERPVPVPQRISTYHRVVAAYRDDRDHHEVSKDSLGRACRVLQALAAEAERRGYRVSGRVKDRQRDSLSQGPMQISIGESGYRIRIREQGAPGGAPKPYSPYDRTGTPLWQAVKKNVFVPTGKLQITIDSGYSRDGRPAEFRDTKTTTLEERLPAILRELEVRAREADWQRQEREREAERRRQQWERAVEKAKSEFREAQYAKILVRQLDSWRMTKELDIYLPEMREAVAGIADGNDRADAARWLDWITEYRAKIDPLGGSLSMPRPREPAPEDLKPFLGGWNPYGP